MTYERNDATARQKETQICSAESGSPPAQLRNRQSALCIWLPFPSFTSRREVLLNFASPATATSCDCQPRPLPPKNRKGKRFPAANAFLLFPLSAFGFVAETFVFRRSTPDP